MKKKRAFKIAIIISAIILSIVILLFTIRFISINFTNKEKNLAVLVYDLCESNDYEKVSDVYESFFNENNHEEILEKYKYTVFKKEPELVENLLWAKYILSLAMTNKYDQFERAFNLFIDSEGKDHNDIFLMIWNFVINDNQMKYDDVEKLNHFIDGLCQYSDEIKFYSKMFQYYTCSYFEQNEIKKQIDIEIDKLLSDANIGEDFTVYENQRMGYTSMILMSNNYEKFNSMFVEEYSKRTLSGTDILSMTASNRLSQMQTEALNTSLDNLYKSLSNQGADELTLRKVENIKLIINKQSEELLDN